MYHAIKINTAELAWIRVALHRELQLQRGIEKRAVNARCASEAGANIQILHDLLANLPLGSTIDSRRAEAIAE